MSPPPKPGLGPAIAAVFKLQWRRLVRGKKLRLGVAVTSLVVVAVVIVRYASDTVEPKLVVEAGTALGFFGLLVYLVPFLMTSGAIAEEVESRTFAYLSSRPVGRLSITLGKYLAGVAMAAAILVAGLVLLHLGAYVASPTEMVDELVPTLRAIGASLLLTLLYGAICMFWGAIATEAAGIVSFLYLVVFEFASGKLPSFLRFGSMNYHATQLAGLPKGGLMVDTVPDVAPWGPLAAIVAMTLFFLFVGALTVSTSEYRFGKA